MLYAALTFWLFIIVFSAWGVHALWSGMVKPRVVNGVLLPGTLVAQLGHVFGLLVTGNAVTNTSLMGDDESGTPQSEPPAQQRIPVVGPIVVGMLPLLACGGCLYLAAKYLGQGVLGEFSASAAVLPQVLPMTVTGVWDLPRAGIGLAEAVLNSVLHSRLATWQPFVFLYLAVCLTVRMAPFVGNTRGALGAILLTGVTIGVLGNLIPAVDEFVRGNWSMLAFTVATVLFLLLVTLVVQGIVGLIRTLARNE